MFQCPYQPGARQRFSAPVFQQLPDTVPAFSPSRQQTVFQYSSLLVIMKCHRVTSFQLLAAFPGHILPAVSCSSRDISFQQSTSFPESHSSSSLLLFQIHILPEVRYSSRDILPAVSYSSRSISFQRPATLPDPDSSISQLLFQTHILPAVSYFSRSTFFQQSPAFPEP